MKSDEVVSGDGWPVLALAGLITILTTLLSLSLGCFFLGLLFWLSHILRQPSRLILAKPGQIVAPADGLVLDVAEDYFPCQYEHTTKTPALRITIRNRLYDIQVNMSPITGHIVDNEVIPGLFLEWGEDSECWDKARVVNERREIRIRDACDREVVIAQIGSRTARQLVCRLAEGKYVKTGDYIGMMRLAGCCEIFLPLSCQKIVAVGQTVIAGETVLAEFRDTKSSSDKNGADGHPVDV